MTHPISASRVCQPQRSFAGIRLVSARAGELCADIVVLKQPEALLINLEFSKQSRSDHRSTTVRTDRRSESVDWPKCDTPVIELRRPVDAVRQRIDARDDVEARAAAHQRKERAGEKKMGITRNS